MEICLATKQYEKEIIIFFNSYLDKKSDAITGRELFCPFGVSAAIARGQIIMVLDNAKIVAALRFYPRKRDEIVSIYQFAIDENNRGKGLLQKMLCSTGYPVLKRCVP